MLSVLGFVAAGLAVAAGALVQGAVGFGLALVATPSLALIDPVLVPVPVLVVTSLHAVATLFREPRGVDWRGVGWALLGRVPGTVAGVAVVVLFPPRLFAATVAVIVLLCVAVSLAPVRIRPTPPLLVAAGVVSGVSGTAASIGGPPIALLYQSEAGPRIRATMGAYFVGGTVVSLTGLVVGGAVTGSGLLIGLALVPFLVVGFLLSGPARKLIDRGWTRPAVLTLSTVAALGLLAQAAFG